MLGGNFFSATLVLGKELDSQSLDQRQESVVENSSGSSKEVSTVNQSEANRKTESSSHEMDTSVVRSSQSQGQPRIRKQTSMNSNEAIDIKLTDSFFPNDNFRKAIADQLKVSEGASITEKIPQLIGLSVSSNIDNFDGIHYLSNLQTLILNGGVIKSVDLSKAQITNFFLNAPDITELILPETVKNLSIEQPALNKEVITTNGQTLLPYVEIFQKNYDPTRVILDSEDEKLWEKVPQGFLLRKHVAGIPTKLKYVYQANSTSRLTVSINITNSKSILLNSELIKDPGVLKALKYTLQQVLDGVYTGVPEISNWLTQGIIDGNEPITIENLASIKSIVNDESEPLVINNLDDLKFLPNLQNVFFRNTSIKNADFSSVNTLKNITISTGSIGKVHLGENYNLKNLTIEKAELTGELDLTQYKELESVILGGNYLENIIIDQNRQLKTLAVENNLLSEINVNNSEKLESLNIESNVSISSLDVSANPKLIDLFASYTAISDLNLNENKNLEFLTLNRTKIKELDLTNQTKLNTLLIVDAGKLEELIYPNNTLKHIDIKSNALPYLDLEEGLSFSKAELSIQTFEREISYENGSWVLDLEALLKDKERIKNLSLREVPKDMEKDLLWRIEGNKAIFEGEGIPISFGYNYRIAQDQDNLMGVNVFVKASKKQVNFELNGGVGDAEPQQVWPGEFIQQPDEPKKEGHVFEGWYLEGAAWDFTKDKMIGEDITLTAKWKESAPKSQNFVVSFESNGGSLIPNQVVEEGKHVTEPKQPEKNGYEFVGWYRDKNLNDLWDFKTPVTSNQTLYAKWKEKSALKIDESTKSNSPNNLISPKTTIPVSKSQLNAKKSYPKTSDSTNYILIFVGFLFVVVTIRLKIKTNHYFNKM